MNNKMFSSTHMARGVMAALAMTFTIIRAAAEVQSPAAQRGLTFVRANCAQCHAIDKTSESPLKIALPFRVLHLKYPVESLRTPLTEGIVASHPTMPAFRLDPGQATDVIAYLKTLER